VFAYCFSSIDGNFIICFISVFHAQIVVFDIEIYVWENDLFFNGTPKNSRHFVAIQLNYWVLDVNLGRDYCQKCLLLLVNDGIARIRITMGNSGLFDVVFYNIYMR
jgi:hypothetical protein